MNMELSGMMNIGLCQTLPDGLTIGGGVAVDLGSLNLFDLGWGLAIVDVALWSGLFGGGADVH